MNALVQQVSNSIQDSYYQQRAALLSKSKGELSDIVHECETLRMHKDFSVRSAAEVVRAAAVIILEERG